MIIKLNSDLSTIVKNFECIDRSYAKFLKKEALADLNHNVSTTYVKVLDNAIAGYVTLTFNSYENKSVHRFPLKHLHIAKLATNSKHSGQGIGSALVYFSFQKALEIKEQVALYGVDL